MLLGQVKEIVNQEDSKNYDLIVPGEDITLHTLDSIEACGWNLKMTETAQKHLCQRLNIPYSYLSRCDNDIQHENLEGWKHFLTGKDLRLRCNHEKGVRAIFTKAYKPTDNKAVVAKLYDSGYNDNSEVKFSLDDNLMKIDITNPGEMFKAGGENYPGICVLNSETGHSSVRFMSYILRLACTNGLIVPSQVSVRKRHIVDNLLDDYVSPELLRKAAIEAKKLIIFSLDSEVKDPDSTLLSFSSRFKLDAGEVEAIKWGFSFEPGHTMFNIVQAFTKGEQAQWLNMPQRVRLQEFGGKILNTLA